MNELYSSDMPFLRNKGVGEDYIVRICNVLKFNMLVYIHYTSSRQYMYMCVCASMSNNLPTYL